MEQEPTDFLKHWLWKKAKEYFRCGKSESSIINSLEGNWLPREVKIRLGDFLNRNRFESEDWYGSIIRTTDRLQELNEEYTSFCTQKTHEYIVWRPA